ncbi:HD domain-containing protein [Nonomuraea solani]|uniref:HD domain-containing protein n=1 Tax=Nonomuraea solani TaxID=1144553 RepID=A0A1H5Z4L1_9ACTN|nr:HD domain-containing protein [Nonomuraea solani]SEG31202.1 HD domain-containing protein [Nonomuraea solani]
MTLRPLLDVVGDSLTGERLHLVRRAYVVAAYWHRGQLRKSGDPYITHPVAVATILAEWGMDHEMLCAGLLHDVLADTACPEEDLAAEFGEPIVNLVRECGALYYAERRSPDWESATCERVLALKIADRLHNQRTIGFLPGVRQHRISRETLDIIAPIARRLGLEPVEEELRRLSIANLAGEGGVQATFSVIAVGAIMLPHAARGRWLEEWLGELHALPGGKARWGFALRMVAGMPRMSLALRGHSRHRPRCAGRVAVRGLRWVLASDLRTWGLLMPLLGWLVLDTAAGRIGDAVVVLITVPPVLAAGVHALRDRFRDGDGRR